MIIAMIPNDNATRKRKTSSAASEEKDAMTERILKRLRGDSNEQLHPPEQRSLLGSGSARMPDQVGGLGSVQFPGLSLAGTGQDLGTLPDATTASLITLYAAHQQMLGLSQVPQHPASIMNHAALSGIPRITTAAGLQYLDSINAALQQPVRVIERPPGEHGLSFTASKSSASCLSPPEPVDAVASLSQGGSEKFQPSYVESSKDVQCSASIASSENESQRSGNLKSTAMESILCIQMPLSIDEDPNWLSEFQCFVRSDLVEYFSATEDKMSAPMKRKGVTPLQVGLRCRYCADWDPDDRTTRSTAFPSSIRQMYQSVTMMIREHLPSCSAIPREQLERFEKLRGINNQGATDLRHYWSYSAHKLGLIDSESGITITAKSIEQGKKLPCFRGAMFPDGQQAYEDAGREVAKKEELVSLVTPQDRSITSEFIYTIMSQLQLITLSPSDSVGKRKNFWRGLPGLGCYYCTQAGRYGSSRVFASRRYTLPDKVRGMYDHFRRCTMCPPAVKAALKALHESELEEGEGSKSTTEDDKKFFDLLWSRMGVKESRSKK